MSGVPRRVPDEKWREEKRDEGMMGREGEKKKRDYLLGRDISRSSCDGAHTHALL